MNLIPNTSALQNIYNDKYWYSKKDMEKVFRGFEEGGKSFYNDRLDSIKRHRGSGRLLDIGCNYGIFLRLAREAGYEVCGIDISRPAVKYAREKLKLEVLHTTIKQARFPTGSFDIITMFGVLEHLNDPLGDLKEIYRVL